MRLDFLWLEVTQKCNLACQHCYVSSSPHLPLHDRMTFEDWCHVITEARALGCSSLQFIGGEPLLYPRIHDLIALARQQGYTLIEVYTNGTTITSDVAARLVSNDVQVACSLYSDKASVHDAVTGHAGSFERTVAALRRLKAHHAEVRIGFIEMTANAGEFEATQAFLSELGITRIGHDHARHFGRATTPLHGSRGGKFGDMCGRCWNGKLCITNSGDAYPCIMGRKFRVGNVLDEGFRPVVAGQPLGAFREEFAGEVARRQRLEQQGCSPDIGPCTPDCNPAGSCKPDTGCKPDIFPCMPDCTPFEPQCAPTCEPLPKCSPDPGPTNPEEASRGATRDAH